MPRSSRRRSAVAFRADMHGGAHCRARASRQAQGMNISFAAANPDHEFVTEWGQLRERAESISRTCRQAPGVEAVGLAVQELAEACSLLNATVRGLAYAMSVDSYCEQPSRLTTSAELGIRSVTWRLHHLADVLGRCEEACGVVGEATHAMVGGSATATPRRRAVHQPLGRR
jgi:hypothetical protein